MSALVIALASVVFAAATARLLQPTPVSGHPNAMAAVTAPPGTPSPACLVLVFRLQTPSGEAPDAPTMLAMRTLLQHQLMLLGEEGHIARRSDGAVVVRVATTDDPERIVQALTATPTLEIVDPLGQTLTPGTIITTTHGESESASWATPQPQWSETMMDVSFPSLVDQDDFAAVSLREDPATGQPVIAFSLKRDAAQRFADYTQTHIGLPMAIVLDQRVLAAPTITSAIAGEGIIAGVTPDEAPLLAGQLALGILGPLSLEEPSGSTATPSSRQPACA